VIKEAVRTAPKSVKIYHEESETSFYHQQPKWEDYSSSKLRDHDLDDLDSCDDEYECEGKWTCREPANLYERAICDERKCCFKKINYEEAPDMH
jgi:hypothetical protein